jgi:uncharacterized protein (TIGR00297 family)
VSGHSEVTRQVVHLAVGTIAFSLRYLTWAEAVACAAAATVFNVVLLPRLAGRTLMRPGEAGAPWASGLAIYPASVLTLVLVFRASPDLAAAAWGILAFGDGAATLVGRTFGHVSGGWPWNPAKTYAGSAAFWAAGALAATLLMWWTAPAVATLRPWWLLALAPAVAALVATLVETLPIRLDDNVSVPLAAGLVLWVFSLIDGQYAAGALAAALQRFPPALAVNVAVAALSWRLGVVSTSGVTAGLAIGLSIWLAAGASAWALLFCTFLVASVASRLGLQRKRLLGIEQELGGRRGAGNALANCIVAVAAAILSALSGAPGAARVALVTALVAGSSDTVASEIGKAWGRRTWSALTLRPVAPGTIGGMSLEGTAAGMIAALALAVLAAALGLVPLAATWAIATGATVAMLAEGILGAALEPRGILDNDVLNFLDTLFAAAIALALWTRLGA